MSRVDDGRGGRSGAELLVAVCAPGDLSATLLQAAARARVEQRPVTVAVMERPRGWTFDAAVVGLTDRRRGLELAVLVAAVRVVAEFAGVQLREVLTLRTPRALSRGGRDRLLSRRLVELADDRGAELHPVGPTPDPATAYPAADPTAAADAFPTGGAR